uniref:Uncharacterized protein n=1 Tax=Rhizophora mucronata TaxID=61149 RepID=A0A2P2JQV1_RHIMU
MASVGNDPAHLPCNYSTTYGACDSPCIIASTL